MKSRAAAVALVAVLFGAPARAASGDAADLLRQATESFDNGAFARSRELLLQAQKVARGSGQLGRICLYLGLNAAVEGNSEEARRRFREALTHQPTLRVDPQRFKPEFVQAFDAVRRETVGRLQVSAAGAPGALVWVDGARRGPPPLGLDVVAGSHVVELRDGRGGRQVQRQVVALAGKTTTVTLQLPAPTTRPVAPARPAPGRRRLWAWVAGAGAVALAGVAVGVGLSARADHDEACGLLAGDRDCADRRRLADPADGSRYRELHDAVGRKELATNVCWGIAGALAASSAVLFLLEGRQDQPAARVGLGPGGLSLGVRY